MTLTDHKLMWQRLFGGLCVLCQQAVDGLAAERQLCTYCLADLPWLAPSEPEEVDDPDRGGPICRAVTPLHYAGAARNWVLATKHANGLVAARVLGTLLAEAVQDAYQSVELPITPLPDVIVPVPLSSLRLLRRGHNQAALIAAPVARLLGIRIERRAVRRKRHTAIQPGLNPRQRRVNLGGAFHCRERRRALFSDLSVAIVDDVLTTGATAESLAGVLLDAGAREVHLWCPTRSRATATLVDCVDRPRRY